MGSALLALAVAWPVHAQQANQPPVSAPGEEAAVENGGEITVTARRRSESLQQVPIAVTVLTAEQIARAGVKSVSDFANLTPNVTFDNALNLGTNFLTIRGQSQAQYGPPPAAIVVDGVLQMSPLQFNVDEFDLSLGDIAERVGYAEGAVLRMLLRRSLGMGVKEIRRAL